MKKRPTFKIWDKKERKWYKPIFKAYQGELDDLFLTPSGDLVRHTMNGIEHESLFPNRYEVVVDANNSNLKDSHEKGIIDEHWQDFWRCEIDPELSDKLCNLDVKVMALVQAHNATLKDQGEEKCSSENCPMAFMDKHKKGIVGCIYAKSTPLERVREKIGKLKISERLITVAYEDAALQYKRYNEGVQDAFDIVVKEMETK